MFSALDVERTISRSESRASLQCTFRLTVTLLYSKNVSYAIWMPELARAHMTLARGNHLLSVGHSAPQDAWARENYESVSSKDKLAKRVELLPEETLYLIERGSMFCWKQDDPAVPIEPGCEEQLGSPMTVQQAYAEMIGKEEITLEKYQVSTEMCVSWKSGNSDVIQVFAYLKRLGYVVTRARAPNKFYPVPPPYKASVKSGQQRNILSRICESFLWPFRALFSKNIDWWKPLRPGTFIHRTLGYCTLSFFSLQSFPYLTSTASIFTSLRLLPVGHSLPLFNSRKDALTGPSTESPYTIFYNLYKPATPYRKTYPPPPDFQIVVIKLVNPECLFCIYTNNNAQWTNDPHADPARTNFSFRTSPRSPSSRAPEALHTSISGQENVTSCRYPTQIRLHTSSTSLLANPLMAFSFPLLAEIYI